MFFFFCEQHTSAYNQNLFIINMHSYPKSNILTQFCNSLAMFRLNMWGFSQISTGLIHWGHVTHICVSELTSIGSDNGLPNFDKKNNDTILCMFYDTCTWCLGMCGRCLPGAGLLLWEIHVRQGKNMTCLFVLEVHVYAAYQRALYINTLLVSASGKHLRDLGKMLSLSW